MGGAKPGGAHVARIRALEEEAFTGATHLIAVDMGQARILADSFDVPSNKVTVIPNAVDAAGIATLSAGLGTSGIHEPYFVVPRRLVKKNGVDVAVQAMTLLQHSVSTLVIAGSGPLLDELRHSATNLNLAGRIVFLGDVATEALLPLMRRSSGVIIPSVPSEGVVEATSLAALEALACGAPLIASSIGGLSEIVSRAAAGFLFPPGDAIALAGIMRELEDTPLDRLDVLRKRSLAAAQLFDVHPWFEAIKAVYTTLSPAIAPTLAL